MAYNPSFSTSQILYLPSGIVLTDTSTGDSTGIVSRAVFLQQYNGAPLVPTGTTTSYIVWPFADSGITIEALLEDTALNITVQWLNNLGEALYTSTQLVEFSLYNSQFDYELTAAQAADPGIVNNTAYYTNRMIFRVNIDSAAQAISLGSDITNAQYSNNRATYMRVNENLYF